MTYSYRAYGLSLQSDTPLPALRGGSFERPDLTLTLNSEPHWVRAAFQLTPRVQKRGPIDPGQQDPGFRVTNLGADDFFQLAYGDGTRFVLDQSARHIWGKCPAPLTIEDVATYLLGPVFGFVLRHRGVISLHASAFCVNGHGVMLIGESAAGKSTTVASLALAGFPVLAEDISAIQPDREIFDVQPGYPRICLWPDSVQALLGSAEALPLLTPTWEKRYLALDGMRANFESRPQRLGAIYVLAPRGETSDLPRIDQLDKREALMELVQNTYMNWLLNRDQRAAELDILARIVDRVPVRRVIAHCDPARLPALRDVIAGDATNLLPVRRFLAHIA